MATPIVLKHCHRCGTTKPITEFAACKSRRDGVQGYCKPCKKRQLQEWRHTPEGRLKSIAAVRRYQRTENGKRTMLKVDQKRKDSVQVKARAKVRDYVAHGRMPAARTLPCVGCGKPAHEYHHHNGYEREHWLDVVPVCVPCHKD